LLIPQVTFTSLTKIKKLKIKTKTKADKNTFGWLTQV